MQLSIHITRITDIEVFGSPGLFSFCTVRHDPPQQVTKLRAMERHCSLPTHSTSVCSCARWVESSDSRPQIPLSCCHTQLVCLESGLPHTVGVFGLSYSHRIVFFSDSTSRMCRLLLSPFHFVFPQKRNAVPDISPVPLQVTTDSETNHESADRGSSFEPLVVVAVSCRFLCFQVCFSFAQEGCLVLSLYTAFLPGLATRCLPVLFECITKRDMDRVWKI